MQPTIKTAMAFLPSKCLPPPVMSQRRSSQAIYTSHSLTKRDRSPPAVAHQTKSSQQILHARHSDKPPFIVNHDCQSIHCRAEDSIAMNCRKPHGDKKAMVQCVCCRQRYKTRGKRSMRFCNAIFFDTKDLIGIVSIGCRITLSLLELTWFLTYTCISIIVMLSSNDSFVHT